MMFTHYRCMMYYQKILTKYSLLIDKTIYNKMEIFDRKRIKSGDKFFTIKRFNVKSQVFFIGCSNYNDVYTKIVKILNLTTFRFLSACVKIDLAYATIK